MPDLPLNNRRVHCAHPLHAGPSLPLAVWSGTDDQQPPALICPACAHHHPNPGPLAPVHYPLPPGDAPANEPLETVPAPD